VCVFLVAMGVLRVLLGGEGLTKRSLFHNKVLWLMGGIWFLPSISTGPFMEVTRGGETLLKFVDQSWLEKYGGQGASAGYSLLGARMDYSLFTGVRGYLFSFLLVVGFVLYYL